jgi:hypothetical protein
MFSMFPTLFRGLTVVVPDEENVDADVDEDDDPEVVDEWGNAPDPASLLRKPRNRGVYCMNPPII